MNAILYSVQRQRSLPQWRLSALRRPQPTLTLVQLARQRPETLTNRILVNHTPQFYITTPNPAELFSTSPSRAREDDPRALGGR